MSLLTGKKSDYLTGYKIVAVDEEGIYRSILTWEPFTVGQVPTIPEKIDKRNPILRAYIGDLHKLDFFKEWVMYDPEYVGYSSAFVTIKDARYLKVRINSFIPKTKKVTLKIVKVTFTSTMEVMYGAYNVFAGQYIEKIEEV